ncbi:MAG: glycosyltransferase family 2 protein [Candidatus Nanoarchaeia archaeon]
MKKVLIGCPTYNKQEFCLDEFIEGLRGLSYEADVIFVDNSEGDAYFKKLKKLETGRDVTVLKDVPGDSRISRIISSRNIVRDYFLKNGYKYLLFLDTDIIPPKDAVQQLLKADSDIASGVYLCRQKIGDSFHVQPAIYKPHGDTSVVTVTVEDVLPNRLMAISVCGMGCCLIRRSVLEKISFRPLTESKSCGEDAAFCSDARKAGFKILANTEAKCAHIGRQETYDFKRVLSISYS